MKCNQVNCYWNMYNEKSKNYNTELSMICVSESLMEHYDENEEFKMTENSKTCKGYLDFEEFCGVKKF